MAEETEPNADPSMEEILASIRKIISDDTPQPAEPEPEPVPEPVAEPETPPQEEVLELTQMIQDDGSVMDFAAVPVEEPAPPPPPPPPPPPSPPLAETDPLVSEPAANSAASAFSSFANTVDIERLSSGGRRPTFVGNGSRTLEDMVIELMRPLLKDWLDQNLPAIVERLVQKEIERISHRG